MQGLGLLWLLLHCTLQFDMTAIPAEKHHYYLIHGLMKYLPEDNLCGGVEGLRGGAWLSQVPGCPDRCPIT